jgi:8-oxo-dGTP pyrophosphatase MutT (NUDIX family)
VIAAAVLVLPGASSISERRVLLQQRPLSKDFALRWECPGGKVERHESHHGALARELREELGIEVARERRFGGRRSALHRRARYLVRHRRVRGPRRGLHPVLSRPEVERLPDPEGGAGLGLVRQERARGALEDAGESQRADFDPCRRLGRLIVSKKLPMHPDTAFCLGCAAVLIVLIVCQTLVRIFAH